MNFDEYKEFTNETAIYPMTPADIEEISQTTFLEDFANWIALSYVIGKLNGEAGELAELQFKALRDEACQISPERKEAMKKELGDVLYYVARIAIHLGVSLDDVATDNMAKLRSRKDRGVLQGSGDNR